MYVPLAILQVVCGLIGGNLAAILTPDESNYISSEVRRRGGKSITKAHFRTKRNEKKTTCLLLKFNY